MFHRNEYCTLFSPGYPGIFLTILKQSYQFMIVPEMFLHGYQKLI